MGLRYYGHHYDRGAYTDMALPPKTASTSACSTPSSANDSRASSYQSPALDRACETGDDAEPNRMRWKPNASTAGPTSKKHRNQKIKFRLGKDD